MMSLQAYVEAAVLRQQRAPTFRRCAAPIVVAEAFFHSEAAPPIATVTHALTKLLEPLRPHIAAGGAGLVDAALMCVLPLLRESSELREKAGISSGHPQRIAIDGTPKSNSTFDEQVFRRSEFGASHPLQLESTDSVAPSSTPAAASIDYLNTIEALMVAVEEKERHIGAQRDVIAAMVRETETLRDELLCAERRLAQVTAAAASAAARADEKLLDETARRTIAQRAAADAEERAQSLHRSVRIARSEAEETRARSSTLELEQHMRAAIAVEFGVSLLAAAGSIILRQQRHLLITRSQVHALSRQ